MTDLAPRLTDYSETAAAMANLDLLISVDTSVVHLAGALGKPVWVLLPFAPGFLWLRDRDDSPWYPTMRLFRLPSPGGWEPAIARNRGGSQGPARWRLERPNLDLAEFHDAGGILQRNPTGRMPGVLGLIDGADAVEHDG